MALLEWQIMCANDCLDQKFEKQNKSLIRLNVRLGLVMNIPGSDSLTKEGIKGLQKRNKGRDKNARIFKSCRSDICVGCSSRFKHIDYNT